MRVWQAAFEPDEDIRREIIDRLLRRVAESIAQELLREEENNDGEDPGGMLLQSQHQEG